MLDIDWFSYILPFLHVLGAFHAAWAIVYVQTPQGAVAWAFTLVFLPYIAIPCYWVFGPRKFYSYQHLLEEAEREHKAKLRSLYDNLISHRAELPQELADHQKLLESLTDWSFTHSNQVELLVDGKVTFERIFEAIEAAKKYVLIQFYIVRDDELGKKFEQVLAEKVRQGTPIYFMTDQIGSWALSDSYIQRLRNSGVHVQIFRTTKRLHNRFKLNFRNHRKVVVVDGEIAFTGGHNIGDEYLDQDASIGKWRDTSVCVTGPATLGIQRTFARDWYWCVEELIDLNWKPKVSASSDMSVIPFEWGAVREVDAGTLFFLECIQLAKKRIWISTPYFVPDEAIMSALQAASFRGIEVKLLIPKKADHPVVHLAGMSFLEELIEYEVELYFYDEGFLHQKALLVDDSWASVGTANLDTRSLRLNFELMLLVYSKTFASEVETMLRRDFEKSTRIESQFFENLSWLKQFEMKFCRLFSPVL